MGKAHFFPVFSCLSGKLAETGSQQTVPTAIQSGLCPASLQDLDNDTRIQLLTSNKGVVFSPQSALLQVKFQQNPDLSQTPICLVTFGASLHLSSAT